MIFSHDEISALFHLAVRALDREIFDSLIARGLHANQEFVRDEYKLTVGNWLSCDEYESRSCQNSNHQSLLHEAVLYGNIGIVESIVDPKNNRYQ